MLKNTRRVWCTSLGSVTIIYRFWDRPYATSKNGLSLKSRFGSCDIIACEFLFVFHYNYGQILYCFRNGVRYRSTITIFSYHFYIDADRSMRSHHVQRTVASCFAVLRQLRSNRRSVPSSVYQTLVVALTLTRLDYGNATVAGIPATLINRIQSVLNAAARSIAGLRRSTRISGGSRIFERGRVSSAMREDRLRRGGWGVFFGLFILK